MRHCLKFFETMTPPQPRSIMNEEETVAAAVEAVTSLINLAETTATGENQKRLQDAPPYQDMRRRIIASVRVCATLPTQAIESMPTVGVRGLAESHAEIYTLFALVKRAANDDTAWANLRKGILSAQAETTH